jgi:hypothetical protein
MPILWVGKEVVKMKRNGLPWLIILPVMVIFFIVSQGTAQPKPVLNAPVITHSFAVEKGRYLDVVKLYIEATDPNGDMLRVATVIEETGSGYHSPDWIFLKPNHWTHFAGFLQWNTHSSFGVPEWHNVTLKVSVFDRSGNESNVVVFPFEFLSEVLPKPQAPAPFDQGNIPRLGHVMTELRGSGNFRER